MAPTITYKSVNDSLKRRLNLLQGQQQEAGDNGINVERIREQVKGERAGWVFGATQDELDIFDLVEEVNQNFYSYLELTEDASTNEIRKAYRRLSLILHPDKNDAPDAGLKFRWLASIYEILKDPQKREVYNRVLVEGLPDWRSPVFYYRRMRKIGLMEGLAYLFVIVTVFQYCIYWAHYWERKFTLKVS